MMQDKISPAFSNENVPILFSTDDGFCSYLGVMIESVIENRTAEKNYDIIIFYSEVSENNQNKIKALANEIPNVMIRFVDVSSYFDHLELFVDVEDKRLTKETYYRFIAGEILADSYVKVIYMDADMVSLTDVSRLLDVNLQRYYLAAPYDITGIAYCHKEGNDRIEYRTNVLKLRNPDNYFIAGLIVFNLDKIRQDYPWKKLVKLMTSRNWMQHDQDVLNYICRDGKALLLHPAWNVLQDYGKNRFLPDALKKMWLESEQNPNIIHYGGGNKPWKRNNVVREEYFWRYAAKTSFFPTIVCEMLKQEHVYPATMWKQLDKDIATVQNEMLCNCIPPTRSDIFTAMTKLAVQRCITHPDNPLFGAIVAKYYTLRVDIRNRGAKGCNVIEKSVVPAPLFVRRPGWLPDGVTIESVAGKMNIVLQCQGDGELAVSLMGRDLRDATGKRYPVWIDCTYFAVNEETIFSDTKTVCHDKQYVYRKTVTDGEIIRLEMVWSECQSSNVLDEYRQLQADLKNANDKARVTETALENANSKICATEVALEREKELSRKELITLQKQYAKYSTLRVDIRNRGTENNNIIEQSITPEPVFLRRPNWLANGMTIESVAGIMTIIFQCQGNGGLEVALMGQDVRNADGVRYPVWIDCTYFAVNGEVVFNNTKTVCHDKRYVYSRTVTDGEIVRLEMAWSECQSSSVLDEYRQLQSDLKNANDKLRATEIALKKANEKLSATVGCEQLNTKLI